MRYSENTTTAIEQRYQQYIYQWTGAVPSSDQLAAFFRLQRERDAVGEESERIARMIMGLEGQYDYHVSPPALDRQKNALRIEIIPPSTRCALKPLTVGAARVAVGHPVMTERYWSLYGVCPGLTNCNLCELAHRGLLGQSNARGT